MAREVLRDEPLRILPGRGMTVGDRTRPITTIDLAGTRSRDLVVRYLGRAINQAGG